MKKAQTVWVRNNGKLPFSNRYDGEDFEILPGEAVEILAECATLCLGFGEEDKTRCLRRLGWAFTQNGRAEAMARLDTFSFHMSEHEAKEHGNKKQATSSAPGRVEPSAIPSGVAEEVAPRAAPVAAPVGPLQKLAAAQALAG